MEPSTEPRTPRASAGTRPARRVLVVAGSRSTLDGVGRQLAEYLGGESGVGVALLSTNEGLRRPVEAEAAGLAGGLGGAIILVTSSILRDELVSAGLLSPSTQAIVAERTVDPERLDRVVAIPPGQRVLLVNDDEGTAIECAAQLAGLGLDHVEYLPWWPGRPAPDPGIRIAVTPGESALAPPGLDELIDLGPRVLDFGTIAALLGSLGLLERDAGRFSRRYLDKIVAMGRRLVALVGQERRLNDHFKGVIESLDRGILVYDAGGRVSICTGGLGSLFPIPARGAAGARLSALVRNQALLSFLERDRGDESASFRLADRDVVVRRFETDEGRVAIFRDVSPDGASSVADLERRRRGHVAKYVMGDILGDSASMQRARRIAGRLAATDLSILIHGETGTGKELFASAIHAASARRSGPFLAVDLGALSDDLIESELFGYEEGAFTGARKGGKPGLFELADGGTIFLDEIGNVSAKVQIRLLRVLQEKEVLRVGGSDIHGIDVRVIAATNDDLLELARQGRFREDLYFRLRTGILRIPPLRERLGDIPPLLASFLKAEGADGLAVDPALLDAFGRYSWPGNVRELKNLVTYMLAVREGPGIALCDLPDEGFFDGLARPARACSPEPDGRGSLGADSGPGSGPSTGEAGTARGAASLGRAERLVLVAIQTLAAAGRSAGRDSLSAALRSSGAELSPAEVRTVLASLASRGLVEIGRGRRGTALTELGRASL